MKIPTGEGPCLREAQAEVAVGAAALALITMGAPHESLTGVRGGGAVELAGLAVL